MILKNSRILYFFCIFCIFFCVYGFRKLPYHLIKGTTATLLIYFNFVNVPFSYSSTLLQRTVSQPIAQGVIGIEGDQSAASFPLNGNNFLIKLLSSTDNAVLAGARLKINDISLPFRFQLFDENILVKRDVWNKFIESDPEQLFIVDVCNTVDIDTRECSTDVLYEGKALSKSVIIGENDVQKRRVRIPPYILLKLVGN